MSHPVVILGAGGHAKVLVEALLASAKAIVGVVDPDPALAGRTVHGIPIIGNDDEVMKYPKDSVCLVNGMGSVGCLFRRRELFERFKAKGYTFVPVVHPSAVIASGVELGEGAQVMAGAVIQPGCRIGANTILNTRTSIDHDCRIGDHVHVAPGTVFSGDVSVGNTSHIGPGVTIIQGIAIGQGCVVGAGSVVLKNIPDGVTAYGVPAKVVD